MPCRELVKFVPFRTLTIFSSALLLATWSHASPVTPRPAFEFVDSIGVCTHWNYSDTPYGKRYPEVKQRLIDLGVRHVRDGGGLDSTFARRVRDLGSNGIHTTVIADPGSGVVPSQEYWSPSSARRVLLPDFVKSLGPQFVSGIEVMNEIDLFYKRDGFIHDFTQAGYFYVAGNTEKTNKLTSATNSPVYWGRYITNITRDVYRVMKADPALAGIPVIGPSLGKTYGYGANPFAKGIMFATTDWGCFHPYPGGNPFSHHTPYAGVDWYIGHGGQPSANIDEFKFAFDVYQPPFGTNPMCATETGYFTGTANRSVTEEVQGKYIPRLFLEYYRKGVARTFCYEFLDEFAQPANNEANRGLIRSDLSPKPAYTALKNLITLLNDRSGALTPHPLDYTLQVNPPKGYDRKQYVRHLLFEKTDGTQWLVLWHEIANSSAYTQNGEEIKGTTRSITHPDIPATITFASPVTSAVTFLPNRSINETGRYTAVKELKLAVPDHPLVVKLTRN